MSETVAFEIPGIFTAFWDADTKMMIGRWQSFRTPDVTQIVERHLVEGGRRGAKVCVVDVSQVTGSVLSPADATWVEKNSPILLGKHGYSAVINVVPASALTKMSAERWSRAALGAGVHTYTCGSMEDARTIARNEVSGQSTASR